MKKIALLTLLCLVLSSANFMAFADEANKGWLTKSAEKLGRGTSNAFYTLLEIPYHVTKEFERTDPIGALPSGLFKGVVATIKRGVASVIDIATFYVPTKPLIADYDMGWWTA